MAQTNTVSNHVLKKKIYEVSSEPTHGIDSNSVPLFCTNPGLNKGLDFKLLHILLLSALCRV